MARENGERRVTFKTLFGIASGILGTLAMMLWFVMSDRVKTVEAKTDQLQEKKADKELLIYTMERFEGKLDKLDAFVHEHDRRAARRSKGD